MEGQEQSRRLVRDLLTAQRFAVLSTLSDTGPYASLVAFSAADDLTHLVFATMRATRKFSYLAQHPEVAFLFDNRSNRDIDVREAVAVTATGSAGEITDASARAEALQTYLAKHPHLETFVASPGCAMVRVDVHTYYVVTNFQSVIELHMPRDGRTGAAPPAPPAQERRPAPRGVTSSS